jgi:undecaprenyl diphosphate synthase
VRERRLRSDAIPRHVAIIMDGNGRWAEKRGLSRNEGHHAGLESVRDVVRSAHELGVKILTLYAFSQENWNRPKGEVEALMTLLDRYIDSEVDEIDRNGVQVRVMGRMEDVPHAMILVFALSYGGRQEIVDAARQLVAAAEAGKVHADAVDEKTFASCLYQPDLPDPDLLIRTGAEWRVSNFLLWQIAYSEIHVTDRMWPDFRKPHLVEAIADYQQRERRFGLTSAQVRTGDSEDA